MKTGKTITQLAQRLQSLPSGKASLPVETEAQVGRLLVLGDELPPSDRIGSLR